MDGLGEGQEDFLNRKNLRSALKYWEHSRKLGEHPLACLQIVEFRRQKDGYGETAMGYGIALREILQEVIAELKPDQEEPVYSEKRWRPFLIVSEQFIQGRSPDYICEQLGIARSTYNHEQAQAFGSVIEILRQREFIQTSEGGTREEEGREIAKGTRAPFLAPSKPPYPIVGRENIVQELKEQLIKAGVVNVAAIYGLPGVGKTTLAIELANDPQIINHFEDGILWAGLGRHPDVMALLSFWSSALGLPMDEVAKLLLLEERAKAIHAAIGTRRMLLVMDDVWEASEGMAFKIGGPNCAYLLTTRLPKIAIDFAGAGAKAIQELNIGDGLQLLSRFIPEIVAREPEEARKLVDEVGGLPLAIVLMGKHLQKEAYVGQAHRLQRAMNRLKDKEAWIELSQALTPLDQQPSLPVMTPLSLRTVIAISDESLDETSQKALRALSVFPPKPNIFSETAGLYVSQVPVETLDNLVDSGLLESRPPDRYTLHQSIAEYARMEQDDENPARRFVEFFVRQVEEHQLDFDDLDPDVRNIFTALSIAESLEMRVELVSCVNHLFSFVESKGLFEVVESHLEKAVQAARDLGDGVGLLSVLVHSGKASHHHGNYDHAEKCYQEGMELSQKLGDKSKRGVIFKGLGIVAFSRGRYEEAEDWYRKGLTLVRSIRNRALEGALLANLGVLLNSLGKYEEAEEHFQKALQSARALGDRVTMSRLLMNLGAMAGSHWEYAQAEAYFQESLELARGANRKDIMSFILTNLGTLANNQAQFELAESHFKEALTLAREVNDRVRMSHLHANLGALAITRKEFPQAYAYLEEGLTLARKIGHLENVCLLLTNVAVLLKEQEDFKKSEKYLEEALSLARQMGHRRYCAAILSNWGELHLVTKRRHEADKAFREALKIAEEIHLQEIAAGALHGLARLAAEYGDREDARRKGEESLEIFRRIKHRRADEVKSWLNNFK